MISLLLIVLWLKGTPPQPEPHGALIIGECNEEAARQVFLALMKEKSNKGDYLPDDFAFLCQDSPDPPKQEGI